MFEGGRGPLVDGAPYMDDAFIAKLRDYHLAAKRAHQEHNQPELQLPTAQQAYAISAESYGSGSYLGGLYDGNGTGNGTSSEAGETIDFGGFGAGNPNGNGSYGGPLSAPTYDPPGRGGPDGSDEDDHS